MAVIAQKSICQSGRFEHCKDGFCDKLYSPSFFISLEKIRAQESLHDVTLLCHNRTFKAHRVVLAAASQYFHAMFTGGMKETVMPAVELVGIDSDALERLLKYIYSGTINISGDNVQITLEAADLLDLRSAFDLCIEFIMCNVEPQNSIETFQLATKLADNRLKTCAMECINDNFNLITKFNGFKELDFVCLKYILLSDDLSVCNEIEVIDAILSWVSFDIVGRFPLLEDLLCYARTYYIGPKCLKDYIENARKCYPHVVVSFLETSITDALETTSMEFPMRRSYGSYVHVLGGETSFLNEVRNTEYFENSGNCWKDGVPLRVAKTSFAVAFYEEKLFVIGGMRGSSKLNEVEYYDQKRKLWMPAGSLIKCTGDVGAAVFKNALYVAGGSTGRAAVCRYVERFDMANNNWHVVGKMNSRRRKFCLVSHHQHLYALGGMNDHEGGLSSVESLALNNTRWESKTPMATKRFDFSAVELSGYIYVVGGVSEYMGSMNRVEKYTPETDSWVMCSPMQHCRGGLSAIVHCGRILAVGGIDSCMKVLDNMESYNEDTAEWSLMEEKLLGRSGSAAIVLPFIMQNVS